MQPAFKLDQGKEPMALLSPEALIQLTKVLEFGAKKYSANGWRTGMSYTRILSALLRHVFRYLAGETVDPETGLSHIAHAMCNCMFLLEYEKSHPEFDDRYKEGKSA
jgi:hypothetical protein